MKAIKKALALCLALAMVVTAVPVSTADAAVKSAKLSKSSVTVAGNATKKQTKSVKVTTNADWKQVKVTASSADKKVATVKVSKKTVKVTAVKKGETKVTVNVTGKKSGKKVSKKLTLKVTVCGAGLAVKAPAELTVGDTAKLAVKTTPSTASCTFDVDKKEVATVSDNGTITAVAPGTAKVVVRTDYGKEKIVTVTVKEADKEFGIADLTVKAADMLVATFTAPVDPTSVKFSLKRGTTDVTIATPEWNLDKTVATIKTTAKMTTGTYELTATSADKKATKTAVVEAQKVAKIVILNKVALTGKRAGLDAGEAYIYYDVLDQYGESMRNSVSIDWSTSAKIISKNPATGMITVARPETPPRAFTYNESIFITGVYAKTGVNVSETVTVGQAQALDKVTIGGFIKKNTVEKLDALPADFKDAEYYMLYNIVDQNGNDMKTGRFAAGATMDDVTFVSDSPLVISEIGTAGQVVTIDGKEYDTVLVKPGMRVEQGGEVNVTAIANKTGNKTSLLVPVNMGSVLTSFVVGTPADIITDGQGMHNGSGVELPFTAVDEKGNKVTNFVTIAKQVTFNKLQLTVNGVGNDIVLSQKDDGSSKLTYYDEPVFTTDINAGQYGWDSSLATDGQDRVIAITAIVVGGETNNTMLYIQDKARPVAVSKVNFRSAYVEGDKEDIHLNGKYNRGNVAYISYVDQYGRPMESDETTGFFQASKANRIPGTDFAGYTYGTVVTYTGNGHTTLPLAADLMGTGKADSVFLMNDGKVTVTMKNDVVAAANGEGFKFTVAKRKKVGVDELGNDIHSYESLDRAKNFTYKVLDITKVQNITVDEIGKTFVATSNTNNKYLTSNAADPGNVDLTSCSIPSNYTAADNIETDFRQKIIVRGSYAGKSDIMIPLSYVTVSAGDYLSASGDKADVDGNNPHAQQFAYWLDTSVATIKNSVLYKIVGATNFARQDAEDTIPVNVTKGGVGVCTIEKKVTFSDEKPTATTLNVDGSAVNTANTVVYSYHGGAKYSSFDKASQHHAYWGDMFVLKDQYGRKISGLTFEVKNVKEAAGYVDNNFTIDGNNTNTVKITGAELGDTFTIEARCGKLTGTLNITVGADDNAKINKGGNVYIDTLVTTALEVQRQALLN